MSAPVGAMPTLPTRTRGVLSYPPEVGLWHSAGALATGRQAPRPWAGRGFPLKSDVFALAESAGSPLRATQSKAGSDFAPRPVPRTDVNRRGAVRPATVRDARTRAVGLHPPPHHGLPDRFLSGPSAGWAAGRWCRALGEG